MTDVAFKESQALADQATAYLLERHSASGRRIGWMMIASIFIEAWDLYTISFLLVFLTAQFHPSALLLGLASAGTQAGAIVGALVGGWLMDKLGRRVMFLGTMVMFVAGVVPDLLWRVGLGLGAVLAIVLLLLRFGVPETAIWLIQKGRFREARGVVRSMYGEELTMLPDRDVPMPAGRFLDFFRDIWSDPVRRRATLFGWIASWAEALEFSTFGFYLPILFILLGVSGILATNVLTLGIYCVAIVSGLIGPQLVHRIGQRRLSLYGFGIVLVSLLVAGFAISVNLLWLVPVAAAAMLWGHYWDAENVMTIPSMVAAPRYRGVASGFSYIHVKLPSFLGIFLFPAFFGSIGAANATFLNAIFPLVGLLAAAFLLPEVYGYVEVRRHPAADSAAPSSVSMTTTQAA